MRAYPSRAEVEAVDTGVQLQCDSCGSPEDLVIPDDPELAIYCRDCRSPLRFLDFPEDYCDLGEAD